MSETTTTTTEATVAEKGAKGATKRAAASKKATPNKEAPKAKKAAKKQPTAKAAKAETKPKGQREGSKSATVLELLRRPKGATLAELTAATQWQAHYADVRIMPTCVGNPACGAGIAAMKSA